MYKTTGCPTAIADRDSIISVFGAPKREFYEKRISPELEQIMEGRQIYHRKRGERGLPVTEHETKFSLGVAAPILSEGDLMGAVLIVTDENGAAPNEGEQLLVQTVAGFLGRKMEN